MAEIATYIKCKLVMRGGMQILLPSKHLPIDQYTKMLKILRKAEDWGCGRAATPYHLGNGES